MKESTDMGVTKVKMTRDGKAVTSKLDDDVDIDPDDLDDAQEES